jgi:hypothetical protein
VAFRAALRIRKSGDKFGLARRRSIKSPRLSIRPGHHTGTKRVWGSDNADGGGEFLVTGEPESLPWLCYGTAEPLGYSAGNDLRCGNLSTQASSISYATGLRGPVGSDSSAGGAICHMGGTNLQLARYPDVFPPKTTPRPPASAYPSWGRSTCASRD